MEVKQVIVIRKDLKMRRGKEIAQGCHASMIWLSNRINGVHINLSADEKEWLEGPFTKVTLQVNSEEELLEIFNKAKAEGLMVFMVTDAGKTEFDGVPTRTCLAIGPNKVDKIDKVTSELKLY